MGSWASAQHFGRIMRCHDSFEKYCNDKTKRYGIDRFHDSFNVYRSIWKDLEYTNGIVIHVKSM
jgi:hypothetical protein